MVAADGLDGVDILDLRTGRALATLPMNRRQVASERFNGARTVWGDTWFKTIAENTVGRIAISSDGHYAADFDAEKEIVYVVQTDQGQETLTPEEFSKRYGWKNDPSKVRR